MAIIVKVDEPTKEVTPKQTMDQLITAQITIYGNSNRSWSGLAVIDIEAKENFAEVNLLGGLVSLPTPSLSPFRPPLLKYIPKPST